MQPRRDFSIEHRPLRAGDERFGTVGLVPWDSEIFGFGVAEHRPGDAALLAPDRGEWLGALAAWAREHGVELISLTAGAAQRDVHALVAGSGFQAMDVTLQADLARVPAATFPPPRFPFRPIDASDVDAAAELASHAFVHDRFHTDPLVPEGLAGRRFAWWVRNAFAIRDADNPVFVLGAPGEVRGFFHVVRRGTLGDLRLAAARPDAPFDGHDLFVNVMHALRRMDVRRATARFSAPNTAVMNVYAALGFRFAHPRITYHWHPARTPVRM